MSTADEDRIALRQSDALRLRIRGYSFREIAAELKISLAVAHSDVRTAMSGTLKRTAEELEAERELELHRIDTALRVVAKILDGVLFADESAAQTAALQAEMNLMDVLTGGDELKLKAIDRQVKLQEQRAKLLGLYAPQKVEAAVTGLSLDDLEKRKALALANAEPDPD